mmetsp:Transcript_14045/g.46132  ORF Transcript_14045/g.46132 Transcript_14045/m.46132 type:complete len:211 (+) Transcript_14045:787-1419(+)
MMTPPALSVFGKTALSTSLRSLSSKPLNRMLSWTAFMIIADSSGVFSNTVRCSNSSSRDVVHSALTDGRRTSFGGGRRVGVLTPSSDEKASPSSPSPSSSSSASSSISSLKPSSSSSSPAACCTSSRKFSLSWTHVSMTTWIGSVDSCSASWSESISNRLLTASVSFKYRCLCLSECFTTTVLCVCVSWETSSARAGTAAPRPRSAAKAG